MNPRTAKVAPALAASKILNRMITLDNSDSYANST
jgi:hypothetical protein